MRYRLLLVILLAGCQATHRMHIGAAMLGDDTSTLTPYVMYDREGKNDSHFQIGYHRYFHVALIKCAGWLSLSGCAGLSYIPGGLPTDVQCSQGNIRIGLGFERDQFSLNAWHESNMRICSPNRGFNFLTAGYKFQ